MEAQGLSQAQTPARSELRPGSTNTAPTAEPTAPVRTDAPNPVREISQSADTVSVRKLRAGESQEENAPAELSTKKELFPDVFPEPLPADLSAAERTAIYAQLLGTGEGPAAEERNDAAKRLFLTTTNLFKDDTVSS